MNTRFYKFSALAILITLSFVTLSVATPIMYEEFQNTPVGPWNSTTAPHWNTTSDPSKGNEINILKDTDEWFGQGVDFQYLEFKKEDTASGSGALHTTSRNTFGPTPVVTVSFLFYQPVVVGENTAFSIYLGKDGVGGASLGGFINLQAGEIYGAEKSVYASYATETALRFDVVFNNNPIGIDAYEYLYDSQTYTLGSQNFDVWIDGVLVLHDQAFRNTGSSYDGDLSSIRLILPSGSGQNQTVYIGELGIFEGGVVGQAIPEPATTAAVFGVGFLLLFAVRKIGR